IGYVFMFIFHVNALWLTLVSTIVIIFNASWKANQRDPNPGRNIWNSIIAEAVETYVTLGILIFSGVIKPVPMQVIPITGMIAGNEIDRKSTRLNSSHVSISYAVFCLKKKNKKSR